MTPDNPWSERFTEAFTAHWILEISGQLSISQDALNRNWSQERSQYQRLYALGIDAYHNLAVVETIDQHKCRKIIISSEYYLSQHKNYRSYQCRYDVIAITGELNKPVIEWIKNAFQA